MTLYSDLANVAVELLTEFGQSITLTRTTGETTDPVSGAVFQGASADQLTTGVMKPYAKNLIDGNLIQVGDKEVVLSPTVAPLTTDRINDMQIVNITEINPAGTVLIYKVQVRE